MSNKAKSLHLLAEDDPTEGEDINLTGDRGAAFWCREREDLLPGCQLPNLKRCGQGFGRPWKMITVVM